MVTSHYEDRSGKTLAVKIFILWAVYLIYILLLTLKPFEFSLDFLLHYFKFQRGLRHALFASFQPLDIGLNILFFVPFGFLTALLLRCQKRINTNILWTAILLSLAASILAELLQLLLIRTSSLTDVLTNGLGGLIGASWGTKVHLAKDRFVRQIIVNRGTFAVKMSAVIYSLVVVVVLNIPLWLNGFYNWNETYHLYLGNEASGDRPWEGTLHEVAIYNRMLTEKEVLQCRDNRRPLTARQSLLALYQFNAAEGRWVNDRVPINPQLPLKINDSLKVRWVTNPPGLQLLAGGFLASAKPASKLNQLLKLQNQLSVEIRMTPANLTQTGPARIITLSAGTDERNLMVGQAGDKLNFRVRTPLTGPNGSVVDLYTEEAVLTTSPQHIVAVFNRGAELIYLNGHPLEDSVRGISNYIPYLTGFGKSVFGKISFCFLLLFPLGWLTQLSVNRNHRSITRGFLWTTLPVILVQACSRLFYQQPFDWAILGVSIFTATIVIILCFFPSSN